MNIERVASRIAAGEKTSGYLDRKTEISPETAQGWANTNSGRDLEHLMTEMLDSNMDPAKIPNALRHIENSAKEVFLELTQTEQDRQVSEAIPA